MNSWTRTMTATLFATALLIGAGPAWAGGAQHASRGAGAATGIDVSYPQCPATSLPSGEAFAVVGVNGGLANNTNSCLGTEFGYAEKLTPTTKQPAAQLYVNTGDPGNSVADWPSPTYPGGFGSSGLTNPYGTCLSVSSTDTAGANSAGCAYEYGYDMVAGISYSGGSVAGDLSDFTNQTAKQLYAYPLWLDVETGNSWQSGSSAALTMNVADLNGMIDAFSQAARAAGTTAAPVGVYSTAYQWGQITGTPTGSTAGHLSGLADWVPGARRESAAASNCSLSSFTGGSVALTQWTAQGYDNDYPCTG